MIKIPNTAIPSVYNISKRAFNNEISSKEGIRLIIAAGVENSRSAQDYIENFKYPLEGKSFSMNLNTFSMEYFFEQIHKG